MEIRINDTQPPTNIINVLVVIITTHQNKRSGVPYTVHGAQYTVHGTRYTVHGILQFITTRNNW